MERLIVFFIAEGHGNFNLLFVTQDMDVLNKYNTNCTLVEMYAS